ncbi:GDYXXLXY domain-containing protein [Helicobacter sp. 23-1045]
MKNKLLIFAFVAQFLLIGGVFVNAYLPVLLGVEVKVRAFGYDPRDILAGNFVRLDYGLRLSNDESIAMPRKGIKEIYVSLSDSNNDGIFEFGKKSLQKPKDGLFIKTKQAYKYSSELKIGAEKYFAPKDRALEIERKLREIPRNSDELSQSSGSFIAIATLKIYNGKVRIVDLEIISGKIK